MDKRTTIIEAVIIKEVDKLFTMPPASEIIKKSRIFKPTPLKSIFNFVPRPTKKLTIVMKVKTIVCFLNKAKKKYVIAANKTVLRRNAKGFFNKRLKPLSIFRWASISIDKMLIGKYSINIMI